MIPLANAATLAAAMGDGVQVIDVRTAEEFATGHIAGSILMPLFAVPLRLTELDRHRPLYVVCQTSARATQAGQLLVDRGYDARVLEGGIVAWTNAGNLLSR